MANWVTDIFFSVICVLKPHTVFAFQQVLTMTDFHRILLRRRGQFPCGSRKERLPMYRQNNTSSSSDIRSDSQETVQVHIETQKWWTLTLQTHECRLHETLLYKLLHGQVLPSFRHGKKSVFWDTWPTLLFSCRHYNFLPPRTFEMTKKDVLTK